MTLATTFESLNFSGGRINQIEALLWECYEPTALRVNSETSKQIDALLLGGDGSWFGLGENGEVGEIESPMVGHVDRYATPKNPEGTIPFVIDDSVFANTIILDEGV